MQTADGLQNCTDEMQMRTVHVQCVPKFPRQLCYPFSQLYVDESQELFDLLVAHTGRFVLMYKEA